MYCSGGRLWLGRKSEQRYKCDDDDDMRRRLKEWCGVERESSQSGVDGPSYFAAGRVPSPVNKDFTLCLNSKATKVYR